MNIQLTFASVFITLLLQPPGTAGGAGTLAPTSQPTGVVDPELVKRLLEGESSTVDVTEETLSRMDKAALLLKEEMDCGLETQRAQAEIVSGIDKLIEEARKSQVGSRGGSKFKRKKESRPGQRQPTAEQGASRAAPKAASGQESGQAPAGGEAGKSGARRSDKAELSRGWGFLPQRDRDEIAQGFDEEYIAKYREQIILYYRQLAEEARRRADDPDRRD